MLSKKILFGLLFLPFIATAKEKGDSIVPEKFIKLPYQMKKPIQVNGSVAVRDSLGIWTIVSDPTKIIEFLYQFLMERQDELNKEIDRRNGHRAFDASQRRIIDDLREKLRKQQQTIDSLTQLSRKAGGYCF